MTRHPNLFPDYPVATIGRSETALEAATVRTAGIRQVETLVASYVEQALANRRRGLNVAVGGDFGTGKTHLLRYAAGCLRAQCATHQLIPGVLGTTTMETTPAQWYRASIGPQMAALDLERLALELLARAAIAVAERAPLTAAIVPELESDPTSALTLVQHELLSRTTVELELIGMFDRLVPEVSAEVRHAIIALAWGTRPALRWLEGEALSGREMLDTDLPESLETDRQAADTLVAVAAVHAELCHPFLLLIDELEHLARFDDTAGGKGNVTWLKRLLERLESCGAMVCIAGHESAWKGHPDFVDRFSPNATIDLQPLTGDQVIEIVEMHVGSVGSFSRQNADTVARLSEGNIRRVLTLLHGLYQRNEGFEVDLPETLIPEVFANGLSQSDGEQAQERLAASLSNLGLRLVRQTAIDSISFDLVGYKNGTPAVAIEIKHALFGKKQHEQAQRFIDKVRVVNRMVPDCIGVFVSQGTLDPSLLALDRSVARILWVDLTEPDFDEKLCQALESILPGASADPGPDPAHREAALSSLGDEIQSIKQAQAMMYEQLETRLSAPREEPSDLDFHPAPASATEDARRAVFDELTHRPTIFRQLSLIAGPLALTTTMVLVLGISAIVLAGVVAEGATNNQSDYTLTRIFMVLGGSLAIVASLAIVVRQLLLLDRFLTFKRERLRDVYVRDLSIKALLDTNLVIEDAFDSWGPRHAPAAATEHLMSIGLLLDFDRTGP